ncbi:hypothetical protein ACFFQW_45230 [Umezawaea endophytica]|uniref:Uncharacterized protein n=1 Tax=Umezawaea endophytica TaxID=1654476 RepID=A0A9X2VXC4_9PSEU|nr:hypothetical protein [Umezawaea endophytica]MCS7484645.1 hypothetical protein [Umezawaea endophytica]
MDQPPLTHDHEPLGLAPGGSLVVSLALALWLAYKAARAFVVWLDHHSTDHPTQEETPMTDPRPRPLRTAASWIGGTLALVSGLVGAGVLTDTQGSATAAVINAVLVLLGTFGVVIATEHKVTPVSDPRDTDGTPLIPAPEPMPFGFK